VQSDRTTAAPRRGISYRRVSSREQAEDGYGLVVQAQHVTDFARDDGWDHAAEFEDAGVKGDLPLHQRPGLRAALAYVRERQHDPMPVGAVLVDRFDRLGRDALESLTAEREFRRLGAEVLYVAGMNGDDPQTKFMRHVMHGMAELDKDMLVARLRSGKEAKAAQGGYVGGRPKVGWRAEDRELVVDQPAASVVRGIFRATAEGWSLRRVATHLHSRRELGQSWTAGKVRSIVRDERYKLGKSPMVDPRIWNKANTKLDERSTRRAQPTAAAA
jgi:site-specific DNA recombinase